MPLLVAYWNETTCKLRITANSSILGVQISDSTMTTTVAGKTMKGKYSYNAESKQVKLQFARLLNIDAKLNYTTSNIDLLFNSDKLLKLIVFLSKQTSNSTLQAISSVADSYDGMMVGLELEKL